MTPPPGDLPWPVEQLRAAGRAYRDAGGRGVPPLACVQAAETARVEAGGEPEPRMVTTLAMLNHLGREHGDWLFGPTQDWIDRHRPAVREDDGAGSPEGWPW